MGLRSMLVAEAQTMRDNLRLASWIFRPPGRGYSLMDWPRFRDIVRTMDLLFSPSFDETFCVVCADGIAEGVPSVVTPDAFVQPLDLSSLLQPVDLSQAKALTIPEQMQEQMKWLNFLQRGLPVSFSTAFKKLGVENWGDTPGATEFEKWKTEQYEMIDIKAKAAQLAQFEMGGAQPNGKGQGKGGGRPPTGQQPPKLEKRGTQSGNLRTVVSQSK